MVEEISKEHELVLYCDASCRLTKPINSLLKLLDRFPLVCGLPSKFAMVRTTHDGMLINLPRPRDLPPVETRGPQAVVTRGCY